jgi:predicted aldo/keto reductase-like oxidoreductase
MPGMIETSLKRLQTDHVDLLMLHVTDKRDQILNNTLMKIFDDACKKGYTRFIGVSTHSNQAEVLDAAIESKFWEAVLVGYNYFSPQNVTASIKNAHEAGLAIIAMKNLLNPQIRPWKALDDIRKDKTSKTTPQQALIKWVLQNQYVDTTIPGMTSFEQLADDCAIMGMKMTFDEHRRLLRYCDNLRGRYCQGVAGCTRCNNKCPYGVSVNDINRCLGYAYGYHDITLAQENYCELPRSGRLDICAKCPECQITCVNGLNLSENIRRARSLFT